MAKVAACVTPMVTHHAFSGSEGEPLNNPSLYRSVVDALQYLTYTRPDLSFTVNKLSQFLQAPTTTHWKALKRVFRYLQGTLQLGLHIMPNSLLHITGFSDADWATYLEDHKSTGGQCFFLGDSLISWSSRKQRVVSRSSSKSEYRSLAYLPVEGLWIRSLL